MLGAHKRPLSSQEEMKRVLPQVHRGGNRASGLVAWAWCPELRRLNTAADVAAFFFHPLPYLLRFFVA